MDTRAVVENIYKHLDAGHIEGAVMACLRLARSINDTFNAAIFLRELYPSKSAVVEALFKELSTLSEEARQFVGEKSLERWLDVHSVEGFEPSEDAEKPKGDRRNLLMVSAGQLQGEIEQWEGSIAEMALPATMGKFDTAAFTDRFINSKFEIRSRIRALQTIKSRIMVRCLNYAIEIGTSAR